MSIASDIRIIVCPCCQEAINNVERHWDMESERWYDIDCWNAIPDPVDWIQEWWDNDGTSEEEL